MFVLSASAETITGKAGSNINWSYDTESYILTFTGSGAMPNYSSSSNTPWGKHVLYTIPVGKKGEIDWTILDDVENIIISNGITSIGNYSFANSQSLVSVEISSTVTTIGKSAFDACEELNSFSWSIPVNATIGSDAFNGTQLITNGVLYLGSTLVQVYSDHFESSTLDIKSNTTKINANAISGCTGITSVTIPSSVTTIGDNAFEGCTSLNTITFDNATNITSWGSNIFKNCKATTTNGYKVVGGCVISDVTDLTKKKYTLPAGIVYIAENAFAGCDNAQYLDLSDYTKAPTFASGALADVTNATTLVAAGYEKNFTAKGWKNVNTTKFSIYNNKFVSRTFLHDAITPTGVAVYRAEVTGSKVKLIKINADNAPCKVAAGEGVFLRASTNKEYTFSPAGQSVAMMSNNAIKGVTEDMTFDGSENAYILATVDGIQDFYRIADTYTLSMGKAYLDGGSSDLSKLNAFEEETSGIDQVETQQSNAKTTIYNMNGQRLSAPQEGINIINGKKYIVK